MKEGQEGRLGKKKGLGHQNNPRRKRKAWRGWWGEGIALERPDQGLSKTLGFENLHRLRQQSLSRQPISMFIFPTENKNGQEFYLQI